MKEELINMPALSVYNSLLNCLQTQRRLKIKRSIEPNFIEATTEMGMAIIKINIRGENKRSYMSFDFDFSILYLFVILVYSFFVFLNFWLGLDTSIQILLILLVIELGALVPWSIKHTKETLIKEIKVALSKESP